MQQHAKTPIINEFEANMTTIKALLLHSDYCKEINCWCKFQLSILPGLITLIR